MPRFAPDLEGVPSGGPHRLFLRSDPALTCRLLAGHSQIEERLTISETTVTLAYQIGSIDALEIAQWTKVFGKDVARKRLLEFLRPFTGVSAPSRAVREITLKKADFSFYGLAAYDLVISLDRSLCTFSSHTLRKIETLEEENSNVSEDESLIHPHYQED